MTVRPRENASAHGLDTLHWTLARPKTPGAWQEWRDSNPQPPVLETGALTKLSYTPAAPQLSRQDAHSFP